MSKNFINFNMYPITRYILKLYAWMAKLVDASDSKSDGCISLWVQVPLQVPLINIEFQQNRYNQLKVKNGRKTTFAVGFANILPSIEDKIGTILIYQNSPYLFCKQTNILFLICSSASNINEVHFLKKSYYYDNIKYEYIINL